jgi:hypothetical protein
MRPSVRRALLLVALALAVEQTVDHRKLEKKFTFPQDVTGTVEFRAAAWAQKTFPGIRFFLPGSMAQWANTYTSIQQFTGGSFTMATNLVQQRATPPSDGADNAARRASHADVAQGIRRRRGRHQRKGQQGILAAVHPSEKFDGVLPALWHESGVTMYRVPLREFTLAHMVPESALARAQGTG